MNVQPNLPSYIFSNSLGQGSYAKVFKAFKKEGCREVVAIKCISKKILNKKSSDNLVSEIEILKKVKHEHIVQMLDFTWDKDCIYVILEFCSGGDLLRYIRMQRCLPEKVVQHFLQQLALALAYLHHNNIVHMDLKPQNILLTSNENPILKIADFGFAKHMDQSFDDKDLRGSPLYMAPEIFTLRDYGPKCDMWSVGIILFECLFGFAPFASATYAELKEKIFDPTPIVLPTRDSVSDMCRDLMSHLLERDPQKRMDHKAFFEHPFVDLEHAPSSESLSKSEKYIKDALQLIKAGHRLHKAYHLYTEGLRHMLAALKYERVSKNKELLRKSIDDHLVHAETLARRIKEGNTSASQQEVHQDNAPFIMDDSETAANLIKLEELCRDNTTLMQGLSDLKQFHLHIKGRDYKKAFTLFEKIFENIHRILSEEPKNERKKLYYIEMEKAMSTAEDIKAYLKTNSGAITGADVAKASKDTIKSCRIM